MRKEIKKILLKFPFIYNKFHRIRKRLRGINPNEEGVAKEELKVLLEHMGKNKVIMEIGTFMGQTTKRLAENNNFVIAIDPFIPDDITGTLQGNYPEDVYLGFIKNTVGKKIVLFPLTSEDAFKFWDKFIKRKVIDSIFIDGLHTFDAVKIDFKWTKYLKVGGHIAFHDTHMEGIKKFINEDIINNPKYKLLWDDGCLKIFQKE